MFNTVDYIASKNNNFIAGSNFEVEVAKETAKAVCFHVLTAYVCDDFEVWVPKSVVTVLEQFGHTQIVKLPAWFIRKDERLRRAGFTNKSLEEALAIARR